MAMQSAMFEIFTKILQATALEGNAWSAARALASHCVVVGLLDNNNLPRQSCSDLGSADFEFSERQLSIHYLLAFADARDHDGQLN